MPVIAESEPSPPFPPAVGGPLAPAEDAPPPPPEVWLTGVLPPVYPYGGNAAIR